MSVLAIDVGNTRVGLGVYTHGRAQDAAVRLAHAELDREMAGTLKKLWELAVNQTREAEDGETEVVIASVAPAVAERIARAAERELHAKVRRIGRGADDIPVPLKTMLRDETAVGVDRLLGALAAYINVEQACAIVHAGTALVVDCVDDEAMFLGGAIAPGLRMAAGALHAQAAQLPEVALSPPSDEAVYGRDTAEAINLGLYAGARGTVRELLERYATALGAWPHVVATGGDAQALLGDTGLVDSFVPDLVLQGVALAWEQARA